MRFLLQFGAFRIIETVEGLKLCGCIKGLIISFSLFCANRLHFLSLILLDEGESELFCVLVHGFDGLADVLVVISF